MSRKSVLLALMLLFVSASAVAARAPTPPPRVVIAASPVTPPLLSTAQGGCFVAGLNGGSETPPTASPATGIAAFVLAPPDPVTTTRKLTYYLSFTTNTVGPETAAHIHVGAPGVAGPILAPLALGN